MRTTLTISAALHVLLLLLAILGLPDPRDRLELIAEPIPVEVVDIADITNTRVAKEPEPKPTPPPQPEPTPPQAVPPPPPPVAEAQPEPPPPEPPPPEKKPEPKPEPLPEPKREPLKEMKVAIAPEPPKVELPKPQALPKKPEKKLDLASVLKNLEKKPDTPQKPDPKPPEQKPPPQQQQQAQSIDEARSDHLSMTEEDALRRQFMACWNPPVGAKGFENMTAEIRIFFDGQMRVQDVKFLGGNGSLSDPAYRSFMESAVRAPLKEACRTLRLPAEKYGSKGTIVMNFSPRDML